MKNQVFGLKIDFDWLESIYVGRNNPPMGSRTHLWHVSDNIKRHAPLKDDFEPKIAQNHTKFMKNQVSGLKIDFDWLELIYVDRNNRPMGSRTHLWHVHMYCF